MPPRNNKPFKLRPVDEDAEATEPVILLANAETLSREKPVRLGPQADEDLSEHQRLHLPDRDESELRTHQPGIDAIIETDPTNPDALEENWGEQSEARHPIPWGWFALLAIAIFWAAFWSLSHFGDEEGHAIELRQNTQMALVENEKEEIEAGRLIDRIDQALRDYFRATSVEELARQVRFPARVTPLMRAYYADKPVFSGELTSIQAFQPLTLHNRGDFWLAKVTLAGGQQYNVLVQVPESGDPLIDWETLVCFQPMNWDDFALERPAGSSMDFRVNVEPDVFYSHEFADASQWVSCRLTALDSDETLFGYAPIASEEAEILRRIFYNNGGRKASLILRLSIPEGLQSRRGVVIEKILSSRWIYLDSPDSGI